MMFKLVMLITIVSLVNERQVEANLDCYEKPDVTGAKKTITGKIANTASQFPNGIKSCEVHPNSSWLFYSQPNFLGKVNAFHSSVGEVYVPDPSFAIKSILRLGDQSKTDGVFLFQNEKFQGGLTKAYFGKLENIQGQINFKSAAVIGPLQWTIERECNGGQTCFTCLHTKKHSAAFIENIKSDGLGAVKSVLPGVCNGTTFTGNNRIPESACRCNPIGAQEDTCNHGWLDDPEQCICNDGYTDLKCYTCDNNAYRVNIGRCQVCDNCVFVNVHWNGSQACFKDGSCTCKQNYQGKLCDSCAANFVLYDKFTPIKCLSQIQFNAVMKVYDFHKNKETNRAKLHGYLDDMYNTGVIYKSHLRYFKFPFVSTKKAAEYAASWTNSYRV